MVLCLPIAKPEAPHIARAHPGLCLSMCSASSIAPEVPNLPAPVSKKRSYSGILPVLIKPSCVCESVTPGATGLRGMTASTTMRLRLFFGAVALSVDKVYSRGPAGDSEGGGCSSSLEEGAIWRWMKGLGITV